jgi:nitroimidazol reductase NimA-like FMN-containing flavoprotein (pyridoxamine 5'-phosphate oxidase superfamily)
MIGSLNKYQIEYFLRSQVIGRIGCSADGQTYVVPITYVYDGEYIYAHTLEGLKTTIMRKNPEVCFEVDHIHNLANWQSVVIFGGYEEITGQSAEDALQMIANRVHPISTSETSVPRHGLERPHKTTATDSKMVVFRIKINQATGKFEKQ